ncbi:hypothetical protein A2609_03300 [Candidatus Kaiserbacteria bacterium RIFOXYD1_FULL_47_14]|uniref:Cell shape-determining protein MreC n=1 Tax=Candidatus Kaiserbacteria bacterium RIFOXYD1_FULL_47_14 TaxID=1798533 RepID=A0A1F6G3X1_9BACT|nr:MAG: hypothetical protein A2609_03300 [Candidatus Kaiserbacteria bacterium RIFOXYD1_FULL_47_14]
MKKTFLSKRNALLSSANISWNFGVLVFALMVLSIRLFVPNFFWYAFTPVFKSANVLAARSHSFLQQFSDTAILALRNEQLTNENIALASENQALIQKMASIEKFICGHLVSTSDVDTKCPQSLKGILAGVVARPPESPYDILVLAAGTRSGVAVGMEVFGAGGVPIGIISSTTTDFSRATLFSSSGIDTLGWVGRNSIPLTISGAGAGTMNAVVARSAGIVAGDMVFVPGPGMLPIGVVSRVDSDISSPSVTLRIQPAINLFSLSWVLIRDTGL